MVRFERVRLDTLLMCHPQVIGSRQLIRHNGGNTLRYQDNREGLQTLPLNPVECEKLYADETNTIADIRKTLNISRATLYRYLRGK
jgi:DNA invertase Pin-like site-specific DNA recombinase